jgi:hemerythrin-like metal-binding protein
MEGRVAMDIVTHNLLPEALVIDVPEVDAQHEEIFFRVEWLKALCLDANGLVDAPAEEFLTLLKEHFSTEEHLARVAGLDFSAHAQKHAESLALMTRAVDEVRSGERDVFSLLRYLEYWFERHIAEEDRPFAAELHAMRF